MLNDNSLGERLNAVKSGKPIPEPPMQPNNAFPTYPPQGTPISLWTYIISQIVQMTGVFLASFLYGIAIKTLFAMDWNYLGCLAVGFLVNHAITVWPRVIKNIFKKKNQ